MLAILPGQIVPSASYVDADGDTVDEVVDVLAEHELVDRVVLEGAADDEHPAAPDERPDGEEVHVDATHRKPSRPV